MSPRRPVCLAAGAMGLALALGLGGCASDPPTRFHSLLPAEPVRAQAIDSAAASPPLLITLAPVRVPAQVDQPQWLVRLPDDSLQLLEQDRWAAPLRDELHAALLETLARRWGAVDNRTAPGGAPAAWRIVVDLTRFESVLGREARIEARWSIARGAAAGTPLLACGSVLREPAETPLGLAQGHRQAVLRLADEIGSTLRTLSRGEPPRCPPTGE